jgi:hypothetical protein
LPRSLIAGCRPYMLARRNTRPKFIAPIRPPSTPRGDTLYRGVPGYELETARKAKRHGTEGDSQSRSRRIESTACRPPSGYLRRTRALARHRSALAFGSVRAFNCRTGPQPRPLPELSRDRLRGHRRNRLCEPCWGAVRRPLKFGRGRLRSTCRNSRSFSSATAALIDRSPAAAVGNLAKFGNFSRRNRPALPSRPWIEPAE